MQACHRPKFRRCPRSVPAKVSWSLLADGDQNVRLAVSSGPMEISSSLSCAQPRCLSRSKQGRISRSSPCCRAKFANIFREPRMEGVTVVNSRTASNTEIGREQVGTPVPNAQRVGRLLHEKQTRHKNGT